MLEKRCRRSLARIFHEIFGLVITLIQVILFSFFLFDAVANAACLSVGNPMRIALGEIEDKPFPPGDHMVLLKTITFPAAVYARCDGINQKGLRSRMYSRFSNGVLQIYTSKLAVRITMDQPLNLKVGDPYYFAITENDREMKLSGGKVEIFKIVPGPLAEKIDDLEQMILIDYEDKNGSWVSMGEYQIVGGRVFASRCKLASFQKNVDLGEVPIRELDDPSAPFVPFSLDFSECPTGLAVKLTMSSNTTPNNILLNQMHEGNKKAAQNVGVQIIDDKGIVPINIPQLISSDNQRHSLTLNYFARLRKIDAGKLAAAGAVQSQVTLNVEYQ